MLERITTQDGAVVSYVESWSLVIVQETKTDKSGYFKRGSGYIMYMCVHVCIYMYMYYKATSADSDRVGVYTNNHSVQQCLPFCKVSLHSTL